MTAPKNLKNGINSRTQTIQTTAGMTGPSSSSEEVIDMDVEAKITSENLDDILSGLKRWELRSFDTITLTDGKRTHTFEINNIVPTDSGKRPLFRQTFPHYFNGNGPIVFVKLGEEIKEEERNGKL